MTRTSKRLPDRHPQQDQIDRWRAESVIGSHVPLGITNVGKIERGKTVQDHFKKKWQRGDFGRFYGLHHIGH